jgi:iron complex transport system ATP-binding protein
MSPSLNPLIELSDVSVVRGSVAILDRVSLAIEQHEHCVVLGPNGSGKSSLLKLLTRSLYPSIVGENAGTVRILGQSHWNVWDLRSQLGIVSAELDHHFTSGRSGRLSAMHTVLTGFFSSELEPDMDRVSDEMNIQATEALAWFELDRLLHRPVATLSTGERRRVMLARAMVSRPKALVLDEPTAGLDIGSQRKLLSRIDDLARHGTTIVLVTHHFEEIVPCIERAILMQSGRVVYDGGLEECLESKRISNIYDYSLTVRRNDHGYWHTISTREF